jgi:hypothetical protein
VIPTLPAVVDYLCSPSKWYPGIVSKFQSTSNLIVPSSDNFDAQHYQLCTGCAALKCVTRRHEAVKSRTMVVLTT